MNPLVMLPGWGLGRGPLAATAETLGGTLLDLPGYGETPATDDFDAAVATVAERLAPGTTLAGWSLGALLALAVAARFPARVGKLLLVAGTASFVQRSGWSEAMPAAVLDGFSAAIAADTAPALRQFVAGFNRGDARARAVTAELLRMAAPASTDVLLAGLGWLRDVDLRAEAARVAAPTLLVHGAADPLMPLAAGRALADRLPGARLAVLDDCAHAPFLSRPADFAGIVSPFLDD